MQEYLSSAKVKKVKGRKERGEKKRSKQRGGVERGRNVPDKSIEHERGYFQSLAESEETTLPPHLRDAHGMQACRIACLSPRRDAKQQMTFHLCASGEQECLQQEQPGRMLRSSHKCQAKDVRKGGRKTMKSDGKRRGIGWASVPGETLMPRETPMRTLRAGVSLWRLAIVFLLQWKRSRRKQDAL
jgi:hypothetical protein